jgi:hypothetical protein
MSGNDRNLVRAIRGPITLITVGALFALNNFTPYDIWKTWPVLLIVFGLLSLLRMTEAPDWYTRARGTDPAPTPASPAFQPYSYPPPPGGYRQSSYPGFTPPPTGTAKGGFGTSAPPRSGDPGQTPPSGDSI